MDGGSTAQYVYNALNQRVSETVGGSTTQFAYNVAGQRLSIWNTASPAGELQEEYYVGNQRVAYFANNMLHFQHQDWTGTERMRTTFNGAVEGTFTSMSFGDAFATVSGSDGDPYHYAVLDHDYSSDTDHAQFRQYSSTPGRWMSPDPYDGSYNPLDPQSLNRYSYALNNPVRFVDPLGLLDPTIICAYFYAAGPGGSGPVGPPLGGSCTYTPGDVDDGGGGGYTGGGNYGAPGGIGGGGTRGGRGTGAGSGATSAPSKSVQTCLSQALSDGRGAALALDVVGDVALGVAISNPASLTALVVGQAASVLGTVNSIQHSDLVGSGIGFSNQVAGATGIVTHGLEIGGFIGTGTSFAKGLGRVGILGAVVSTVTDGAQAISAYARCRSTP